MAFCSFIGHRDAPETLRALPDAAIERHVSKLDKKRPKKKTAMDRSCFF